MILLTSSSLPSQSWPEAYMLVSVTVLPQIVHRPFLYAQCWQWEHTHTRQCAGYGPSRWRTVHRDCCMDCGMLVYSCSRDSP